MLRFKFGAWAVVLMLAALSFGACSDEDDDPAFNPPSNITEALKQLYPAAQNIEWEMKDVYLVLLKAVYTAGTKLSILSSSFSVISQFAFPSNQTSSSSSATQQSAT